MSIATNPRDENWSLAMSWTVACFCGTVFEAPPDRCPTCDSHVPDVHDTGRVDAQPQRPGGTLQRDADAEPFDFGSLERELSELISAAPPACTAAPAAGSSRTARGG
jgi:hypothetical protein